MLASKFIAEKYYLDSKYKYALLYYYNRIVFEPITNISTIDLNYFVQGWFFGEWSQAHIFTTYTGLMCETTDYIDKKNQLLLEEKHILDPRFSKLGKALIIKKFGTADDDGQFQIDSQLLSAIER